MKTIKAIRARCGGLWLALVLLAAWVPLLAQEGERGPLTDTWVLWTRDGHQTQIEAALRAHAAWRKQAGEPRTWQIYQPVIGADLGHYVIRSEGHHWRDFDAAAAWAQSSRADDVYFRDVGPHVARVEHYVVMDDVAHSRWIERDDYRYFGVSRFAPRPGTRPQVLEAMGRIHKALADGGWPRGYAILWTMGGAGGFTVVEGFASYAEMAEPEPDFVQTLGKALGEQAAADTLRQFASAMERIDYTVYVHRPDLSTPR